MKFNNRKEGKAGEKIAVAYLIKKGFEIDKLNYQKKEGEIDIIAREKDCTVFVEVKSRCLNNRRYLEPISSSVSVTKRRKIRFMAKRYIYQSKLNPDGKYRFDVILIKMYKKKAVLKHIKRAF
ncbi:MAG: YraN family protein [Candidatus Moranbacteria bacterium]|nr:YraN family protein [Candidatus Moranbacteria bacterium]